MGLTENDTYHQRSSSSENSQIHNERVTIIWQSVPWCCNNFLGCQTLLRRISFPNIPKYHWDSANLTDIGAPRTAPSTRCTASHRRSQGGSQRGHSPQILENIVILCFEKHFSKQNSVIRLKSSILPPKIFWPLPNFWADYATAASTQVESILPSWWKSQLNRSLLEFLWMQGGILGYTSSKH